MAEAQAKNTGVEEGNRDIKIGELLTAVGVVSSGDLTEAIQIAKRMNLPIGRVIVMSGVITESHLQYAIEAQSLIRDGLLDIETAVTALRGAFDKGKSLQEALSDLRWAPKQDVATNKLGELLVDSMMVSQSQLDNALNASFESGMPLGGTLVLQGVLSAQLLPAVLNAQEQIREGKLTRDDAINNLKSAVMYWAQATESQGRKTYQNLQAFADSGQAGSIGQSRAVATSSGVISAGQGHAQVPATPPHGSPRPQSRQAMPAGYDDLAASQATTDMGLVEMMKLSGFCTEDDIHQAIVNALSNSDIASKLFLATGLLSQVQLDNFVRCRSLIRRGVITAAQALYAIGASKARGISLDEAFQDMELNVPKSGNTW